MGDWLSDNKWRLTLEQFQAFYEDRPKSEKWELIAGVPVMMPPPRIVHQRIASNLSRLLMDACELLRPDWIPDREIGIVIPAEKEWNPEPDVTVVDTDIAIDQIYAPRFYMVAEVLSPNDKPSVLAAKRAWYKAHEHCLAVIFVEQERIGLEIEARADEESPWIKSTLENPDSVLTLPVLGNIGRLQDLYANTPLGCHPSA